MFLDHANNFPQLQSNYSGSPVPSSHIAPELLDLVSTLFFVDRAFYTDRSTDKHSG